MAFEIVGSMNCLKSFINTIITTIWYICKMSVDVFGRQLVRKSVNRNGIPGSRGPPGKGFILTPNGQYDMNNKRLCNLAEPVEQNDAVSVKVMQSVVQQEVRLVYNVTSSMRNDIDNHDVMIGGLEKNLEAHMKHQIEVDEALEELTMRNSQLISHQDERLRALESDGSENDKLMIASLESSVKEQFKRIEIDNKTVQELIFRNSQIIGLLEKRLNALENERAEGGPSARAT